MIVNKSNRNDVLLLLGPPSVQNSFDNDIWLYIERRITQSKITNLGKPKLSVNNVLVLEIDNKGMLSSKKFYDINNMNQLKLADASTVIKYKKNTFLYDFFTSMRQKINDPLGKRKK